MRSHKIITVAAAVYFLTIIFATQSAHCQRTPVFNNPSSKETSSSSRSGSPAYTYKIVNTYPHDSTAFTQGLLFAEGYIYEGTGLYGRSALRKVVLETGRVLQSVQLAADLFGEGITLCRDKIIQLTWKSRKVFVYDKDSFKLKRTFKLFTDGWGITFDGTRLIVSDGSSNLYFLNPETFERIGKVSVYDHNGPVTNLNELEFIRGKIYANVWHSDDIVIINHETGEVTGRVNLEGLSLSAGGDKVYKTLNGIAYDEKNDRLFLTGKLWPKLYEINLITVE